jgi:hypothetical protein
VLALAETGMIAERTGNGLPLDTSKVILRRFLAVYFAATGIVGFGAVVAQLPKLLSTMAPEARVQVGLLFCGFALAFLALVSAGVRLIARRPVLRLCVILQLAQIPIWQTYGSGYRFLCGVFGGLLLEQGSLSTFSSWGASVVLRWEHESTPALLGINLVPILPLVGLLMLWRSSRESHSGTRFVKDQTVIEVTASSSADE